MKTFYLILLVLSHSIWAETEMDSTHLAIIQGFSKIPFQEACWLPDSLNSHTQLRLQKDSNQFEIIEINPAIHQLEIHDPSPPPYSKTLAKAWKYSTATLASTGFIIGTAAFNSPGMGILGATVGLIYGTMLSPIVSLPMQIYYFEKGQYLNHPFCTGCETYAFFSTCKSTSSDIK